MWDRQASQWLSGELEARGLDVTKDAGEALLKRFGTDIAAMGQALDQLEETSGKISGQMIMDRFRNRPDEPTWHITDAIAKGEVDTALKRRISIGKGYAAEAVTEYAPRVAQGLLDLARSQNADLIAIATHGRSGVGRMILGGVTDKVVRGADLPVLVVRPREA